MRVKIWSKSLRRWWAAGGAAEEGVLGAEEAAAGDASDGTTDPAPEVTNVAEAAT